MVLKRAFFVWQFVAALVLPMWLLAGYAVRGDSLGGLLGVALLAPLVLVVELALALLFSARVAVRRARALDAAPMAVLSVFHLALIGFGCSGTGAAWFGLTALVAAVVGFWLAGRLLIDDVRARLRATAAQYGAPQPSRAPIDAGEYVVVKPAAR